MLTNKIYKIIFIFVLFELLTKVPIALIVIFCSYFIN